MALTKEYKVNLSFTNTIVDETFIEKFPNVESVVGKEISLPSAYFMISAIEGNKEQITITLNTYADSMKDYLFSVNKYTFIPSVVEGAENFIKQGYEYLKNAWRIYERY